VSASNSTTTNNLYLAIDQGGHASRALVFNGQGHVITENQCEIGTLYSAYDRVEHDPFKMVSSIRTVVKNVIEKLGPASARIIKAGLATQRSSIVCWDRENGSPLTPIISWQDRRAQDWVEQFSAHGDDIHKITGLYPNAHYGFSKLKWCLDHIPEVYASLQDGSLAWGPMSSFLCWHLLDENPFLVDPVNASRTLLWDIRSMNWSHDLLKMFAIPEGHLPQCVASNYPFGKLSCGSLEIPMTTVTGDQSAALFANGRPQRDTAYITIGTGAFLARITGSQPDLTSRLLSSVVFQNGPDIVYALEGTVNGAGNALSWLSIKTGLDQKIDKLPEWLMVNCEPPLFLNGISGLGTPFWRPHFKSVFIGDGADWQKAVAVIESIVFLLYLNMEEMAVSQAPPEKILIGGGLSKFDGLCMRLANLSGLPVYRSALHENTSMGLAFILAGFPDVWHTQREQCFLPEAAASLHARYLRWKQAIMSALASPNQTHT
jgi:glycerol kinase